MRLVWSVAAVTDIERFAAFLHARFPGQADSVAAVLIEKSQALLQHPRLGRPLQRDPNFRELVVHALRAAYVIQYRVSDDRMVVVRVFHGREDRG